MDLSLCAAFSILDPCNGHSPEAFQYKLLCASMEVQKIKAEARLQESTLWRLQELLSMAMKERDEAREECKRLQECLLLQNTPTAAMGTDSPSSFIHSSSMVSSPASSPWSLQELEEHLNNDDFCAPVSAPAPFEVQQALECFAQSCDVDDGRNLQRFFPGIKPAIKTCQAPPCSNYASEAQADAMAGSVSPSVRSLSRQSSSNSSCSASAQFFYQGQLASMESSGDDNLVSVAAKEASPASSMVANSSAGNDGSSKAACQIPSMYNPEPPVATDSPPAMISMASFNYTSPPTSPTLLIPTLSAGHNGACLMRTASINTQFSRAAGPYPAALKSMSGPRASLSGGAELVTVAATSPQGTPMPVRQVHLPEPPEADPQVMLNSLPEKGKLLQAVMQAGPLLQTLLLAGPLPQWRHPPPALRTGDIPKVPLAQTNVVSPYPTHKPAPAAVLQEPKVPDLTIKGSLTKTSRRRTAETGSCARSKKLRKLSPVPVRAKEAQPMQVEL